MARTRRRTVPVALAEAPSASANWVRGIRFSGFSLLMMGLVLLAVVILAPTLHMLIAQRQAISDLQASVAHERNKVSSVKAERARWNDPSYVRSQVRDRLYYVMPGETSYLIIDDRAASAKAAEKAPVSKSIQATRTDWLATLFDSAMTAGLTDATPPQLDAPPVTPSSIPTTPAKK